MMKHNLSLLFLFFILILGFFLRIVNLQNLPKGFFCDEASIGINAYSLLKAGKDEYGKPWPLFFRAFGEYKNPVQIYSTIPFIALFGLSEFSVRLVSAIYGTLTIIAIYFLVRELFFTSPIPSPSRCLFLSPGRCFLAEVIALFSAGLTAISPWHTHFSRLALEGLSAFVFFTTLGTWVFFKSLQARNQLITFNFSLLIFNLALYSYFPARIFIPLFLFGLLFLLRKSFESKTLFFGILFFIFLSLPLIFHMAIGPGLSRWREVSVFKEKTLSQAVRQMGKNYLAHFSPEFLFKKGDVDMLGQFITRHSVRGVGELYWFQLPLILLGILALITFKKRKGLALILWWLALYPLGSVLTSDASPQATRSIIGVVPFQILSAFGFSYLISLLIKEKDMYVRTHGRSKQCTFYFKTFVISIIFLSLTGLGVAEFVRYLNLYFQDYPNYSSDYWGWQWGPKEIIEYFKTHKDQYDELYMTGQFNAPHIFLKFYDPKGKCQNCFIGGIDRFNPRKKQLFALRVEEVEKLEGQGVKFINKKTLFYPNGEKAFLIGEVISN